MNEKASTVIDLAKYNGPVYTGRQRGELLRETLHLDAMDAEGAIVSVVVPTETYTVSSSFFLGLFGPSVVKAGSKEAFYKRYDFQAPAFLQEVMDGYVARALQTRNLFT